MLRETVKLTGYTGFSYSSQCQKINIYHFILYTFCFCTDGSTGVFMVMIHEREPRCDPYHLRRFLFADTFGSNFEAGRGRRRTN